MSHEKVDRRKFNQFAAAAFGGMVAGTAAGCSKSNDSQPAGGSMPATDPDAMSPEMGSTTRATPEPQNDVAMADVHLCRGLNACKGKGASGENACAGKGACATAERHTCSGQNACKGLGGCGENAGANDCKGKGECAVPLMDDAWKAVRARLAEKFKADGKELGDAPAKPAE